MTKIILKYISILVGVIVSAILSSYGQDIHEKFPLNNLITFLIEKHFSFLHIIVLFFCSILIFCVICDFFQRKNNNFNQEERKKMSKEQKRFIKNENKCIQISEYYRVYFDISFGFDGTPEPIHLKLQDLRNAAIYDLRQKHFFINPVYPNEQVLEKDVKLSVKSELLKTWFSKYSK